VNGAGNDYAKPLRLTPSCPWSSTWDSGWNTPTAIAELFDGPEALRVAPQWATAMWGPVAGPTGRPARL
jgi:hypothetical protein